MTIFIIYCLYHSSRFYELASCGSMAASDQALWFYTLREACLCRFTLNNWDRYAEWARSVESSDMVRAYHAAAAATRISPYIMPRCPESAILYRMWRDHAHAIGLR